MLVCRIEFTHKINEKSRRNRSREIPNHVYNIRLDIIMLYKYVFIECFKFDILVFLRFIVEKFA